MKITIFICIFYISLLSNAMPLKHHTQSAETTIVAYSIIQCSNVVCVVTGCLLLKSL